MAVTYFVDAAHRFDLFLFDFQFGLPQKVGARHKITLTIQNVQNDGNQNEEQWTLNGQSQWKTKLANSRKQTSRGTKNGLNPRVKRHTRRIIVIHLLLAGQRIVRLIQAAPMEYGALHTDARHHHKKFEHEAGSQKGRYGGQA